MNEPYMVEVPGKDGRLRTVGVCLPHEQFAGIVRQKSIEEFRLSQPMWDSEEGMGPLLRQWGENPDVGVYARDVAVLGMHADGVSFTSSSRAGSAKSVLVCSWNIPSAPSVAQRSRRHLFFVTAKSLACACGCEGYHTFDPLLRVFAWSMRCLKNGLQIKWFNPQWPQKSPPHRSWENQGAFVSQVCRPIAGTTARRFRSMMCECDCQPVSPCLEPHSSKLAGIGSGSPSVSAFATWGRNTFAFCAKPRTQAQSWQV